MTPAQHYVAAEEKLKDAAAARLGSDAQAYATDAAMVHALLATVSPRTHLDTVPPGPRPAPRPGERNLFGRSA